MASLALQSGGRRNGLRVGSTRFEASADRQSRHAVDAAATDDKAALKLRDLVRSCGTCPPGPTSSGNADDADRVESVDHCGAPFRCQAVSMNQLSAGTAFAVDYHSQWVGPTASSLRQRVQVGGRGLRASRRMNRSGFMVSKTSWRNAPVPWAGRCDRGMAVGLHSSTWRRSEGQLVIGVDLTKSRTDVGSGEVAYVMIQAVRFPSCTVELSAGHRPGMPGAGRGGGESVGLMFHGGWACRARVRPRGVAGSSVR